MDRPIPYKGEKGYIFISYAHRDAARVWPIIARMQLDGYRVWYDEGIDPGTEWDENIAQHVTECGYFLAFLSENYMASNNCKDELNFSRDQGKPQVLIYLEEVELPKGMAMRMGRTRALHYEQYPDKLDFFHELYASPGIRSFYKANNAPRPKAGKNAPTTFHKQKKSYVKPVLLTLALMAALGIGVYLLLIKALAPAAPPAETTQSPIAAETAEPEQIQYHCLFENELVRVEVLELTLDDQYLTMTCSVANRTDENIDISIYHAYLNGIRCQNQAGTLYAYAGEVTISGLTWSRQELEDYGVDLQNLSEIELYISAPPSGITRVCYHPQEEETAMHQTYTPKAGDQVLLDNEDYLVVLVAGSKNKEAHDLPWIAIVNRTDSDILCEVDDLKMNQYQVEDLGRLELKAQRVGFLQLVVRDYFFPATGYDSVLKLTGIVNIFTAEDALQEHPQTTGRFFIYPQGEKAASKLGPRELTKDQLLFENEHVRIALLGTVTADSSRYPSYLIYMQNLTQRNLQINMDAWSKNREEAGSEVSCGYTALMEPQGYAFALLSEYFLQEDGMPQRIWLEIQGVTYEDIHSDEYGNWLFNGHATMDRIKEDGG